MYGLTGNGALFLTTAASLLASPVCGRVVRHPEALPPSSSVSSLPDADTYGAYVTLGIGQDRDLVLRLDIGDTDRVCNPSVPSVYRQLLHSNPDGQGRGHLNLDDESGSFVQARWTRECIMESKGSEGGAVEVAQRLEMILESVDGEPLDPEVSFVAMLESPDAGERVVSYSLRLESEDFAKRPKTYIHSSTFGRQDKETVSDMPNTPQKSLWKCRGFRCLFDSLRDRIHKLRHDFYEWRKPQQQHVSEIKDELESYTALYEDGGAEEDQDGSEDGESDSVSTSWHTSDQPTENEQVEQQRVKPVETVEADPAVAMVTPSHTPFAMPSIPPPDKSLVMTLVLAAIAFTIFSLSSICLIRMRYTPEIERRPRQVTHRDTPEEHQARVAMRREAVRGFFQSLFCGIFSFSEKDSPPSGPQGRDLQIEAAALVANMNDDSNSPTTTTTMEQELAGFREAASMVSNLIAAEEGRHRMMQRPQPDPIIASPPIPIPSQARPMYPYSEYNYVPSGISSPPSYEVDTAEASMVSDGFRYSPGQFEFQYSPSSSPGAGSLENSNSDRLGYGNKD